MYIDSGNATLKMSQHSVLGKDKGDTVFFMPKRRIGEAEVWLYSRFTLALDGCE